MAFLKFCPCFVAQYLVSFLGMKELIYFNCLFMPCDSKRSVCLPHVAVGWSAVCDCSIIWSYLLPFDPTVWICMLMLI